MQFRSRLTIYWIVLLLFAITSVPVTCQCVTTTICRTYSYHKDSEHRWNRKKKTFISMLWFVGRQNFRNWSHRKKFGNLEFGPMRVYGNMLRTILLFPPPRTTPQYVVPRVLSVFVTSKHTFIGNYIYISTRPPESYQKIIWEYRY